MAKVKCPRLGCNGIGMPAATKKQFSLGKAVVGNTVGFALAGATGGLAGLALGFNGKKKVTFVCQKCGHTFEKKV